MRNSHRIFFSCKMKIAPISKEMLGELRVNPFWALQLVQVVSAQVYYFIINYDNEILYITLRRQKENLKEVQKLTQE